MQKDIVILDLFSGIGGFTKAFEDAGYNITKHYYSEIDKHAKANYQYNFPKARWVGSVQHFRHIARAVEGCNIITFGSPCQDFSLAGTGKGLEGLKSSLIKYAILLIRRLKPDVFIWENVKGAFSTNNSEDYWAIIQAFANIPGYRLEQQLLNTAWVLPQNRERIYLIGHLAGRSSPGVFPITENDCGVDEGATAPTVVRTLTGGGNSGGLHSSMTLVKERGRGAFKPAVKAPTLTVGEKGDIKVISVRRRDNEDGYERYVDVRKDGITNTLATHVNRNRIDDGNGIRRLTEIEFERLQGFPDDWTKWGNYNGKIKRIPKTHRYKMCGNAVTKTIVQIVANKIKNCLTQ